ncbi:MAG: hypothetical protein HY782_01320 [Chloroflexi bacterium]|nr:hypothetical protein [Chloroflexota bacterium]
MSHPLYVAFVWHQHQPDYRDPGSGVACLPWARLHAAKDYLHMAELVADFPAIHCTFNFVPSLVEQLAGIGAGRYTDDWQALSLKENWTAEDKQFLLDHFFSINPRLLERYPGYIRLREQSDSRYVSEQYFLDLAAWFNLAWIDPRAISRDETLRALVAKDHEFSRADVAAILAKHRELAGRVIPLHRELAARGQIELSTSPYYHPILPLLIDQRLAREAIPNIALPAVAFAHPEDAAEQLRRAVNAHRNYFGAAPQGLWPSEGSVGAELLTLIGGQFRWLASDEDILARSLGKAITRDHEGNVTNPRVLYQPYQVASHRSQVAGPKSQAASRHKRDASRRTEDLRPETGDLRLVFRDHVLSDRIGFGYQHMSAHDAAQELLHRLHRIRERIADVERGYLVSIILDGENAWEWYEDNGDPFFRELYQALSNDPALRTVTMGEYLRANPPRATIKRLAAGSWINGNFDTWIGEPAQNRAWELLAQTREQLALWQRDYALAHEDVIARAWDELYIAEGSDWFWWYSTHNNSTQNEMFDELFRGHLQSVYAIIGLPVPDELKEPIRKAIVETRERGIRALVTRQLAGAETAGDEWNGAGIVEPNASTGTMQHAETKLARVFYGYNADDLVFRVETRVDIAPFRVALYLSTPRGERFNARPRDSESDARLALKWEIAVEPGQAEARVYRAEGQEIWRAASFGARATVRNRVIEIALNRQDLGIEWGDSIGVLAALAQERRLVETLPAQGAQSFTLREM